MPSEKGATGNRILDALPKVSFDRLRRHFEPIVLPYRGIVQQAGGEILHITFPTSGVVSLMLPLHDGSVIEIGVIGNEGLVGLPALLDRVDSVHEAVVQGPGEALRVPTQVMRAELDNSSEVRTLVRRFAELFLEQVSQTAACNGLHTLEARCARWLLTMRDRQGSDRFHLTQEFLAVLLGVQRTGVTAVAGSLQRKSLIEYRHGEIEILDPASLESQSCECYRDLKGRLDTFLRDARP